MGLKKLNVSKTQPERDSKVSAQAESIFGSAIVNVCDFDPTGKVLKQFGPPNKEQNIMENVAAFSTDSDQTMETESGSGEAECSDQEDCEQSESDDEWTGEQEDDPMHGDDEDDSSDISASVGNISLVGREVGGQGQFPPIPIEMSSLVLENLTENDTRTVKTVGPYNLTELDLKSIVTADKFINDSVIDLYAALLKQMDCDAHIMSTAFYPLLLLNPFNQMRGFASNGSIFKREMVLFPCNIENFHWVLVVLVKEKRRHYSLRYFDSRTGRSPLRAPEPVEKILGFLTDAWRQFNRLSRFPVFSYDRTTFSIVQQQSDCAVFVMLFMKYLLQKREFNVTNADMTYFRARIAAEIVAGEMIAD